MVEEIYARALQRLATFKIAPVMPALRALNEGAIEDVLNTNGSAYYQFLPCLIDEIRPKQVIELGGAMGVGTLMMLNAKYQDFKLYSITLEEHGLEFSYVVDKYPNLTMKVGNDLDISNWSDVFLHKTDLWFIDTEHTAKQLQAELDLYTRCFKKGTILLFDDIRMPELWPIWEKLPYDKLECTDPMHYSGFGIARV